jgi:integrase
MARTRVFATDPRTRRKVDGVSEHSRAGYYIIDPHTHKRRTFGKGLEALDRAKVAYARIVAAENGITAIRQELELAPDLHPLYERMQPTKYAQAFPERTPAPPENPVNPDGERLTVAQVGELYREWYVRERCDRSAAEAKAAALNEAKLSAHRAALATKVRKGGFKKTEGGPVSKHNKKRRKPKLVSWLAFVPRNIRQRYREHERYFASFTDFVGAGLLISQLDGNHFAQYREHVRALAREKAKPSGKRKKPLTQPDVWANHRLEAVTTAFRRARKLRPMAAWARGLYGADGYLSDLEQTGGHPEARKVKLTREQFAALVDVADTQWRAILYLSANCALENESVSQIDWPHVAHGLMTFPRPKTGRPRQIPLAPQTIAALEAWRKECPTPTGRIFSTEHGTPLAAATDNVGDGFDRLRVALKEQKSYTLAASFKSLRKTAATIAFNAVKTGERELASKMLLGHARADAWKHYVDEAPDFLHKAVKAIQRELFEAPKTRKGGK